MSSKISEISPTLYDSTYLKDWLQQIACNCGADSDIHQEECSYSVALLGLDYGAALIREGQAENRPPWIEAQR